VTQPRRTFVDRLLAAYPLLVAYLALLLLYAWQTTRIPSPWIFTDELQWSLLSRGVAHTGHPQLRMQDTSFHSLYAYLLAPAWWFGGTSPGYAAAKYINAVVMTASLFPAYALGRLFLNRGAATLCAIATAAIPSLALTGVLMPESLAYFWSVLSLWLAARALLRPARGTIAAAVAAAAMAPLVRDQLQVIAFALAVAAVIVTATSSRGRATVAGWTAGDRAGAAILVAGAVIAADVFLAHHSYQWFIGTHYWHRAFTYGLWAFGAFAIGVGVLPVFLALAWALGGPVGTRPDRVLLGLLVGAVLGFGLYTAVKASYISTTFSVRVEERNLIYLSPLVFISAARWVAAGRVRPIPAGLAAAGTAYVLWTTPYHAYEHLYSDAFGLSILQWLNQQWFWTSSDLRWLLVGILAGGVCFTTAQRLMPQAARPLGVFAAVVGVAVIGWNLTGEIAASNGSIQPAKSQLAQLPSPPDWIDRETGRERTMFIGKSLSNSYAFWSLEFWNQSIQDVWSVDATAPPPGPVTTPNFLRTDGALDPQLPDNWVVSPPEIAMIGEVRENAGGLNLYRVPHPIRMESFVSGITLDGWMQDASSFVRFSAKPTQGTVEIAIDRTAACSPGTIRPSRFTFRVSHLEIDSDGQPVAGLPERVVRATVDTCAKRTLRIETQAPFRIDATTRGTFKAGDGRDLSAQVGYDFTPVPG